MTTADSAVDNLAHARFKADFDKLFGAALKMRNANPAVVEKIFPTAALRKEYLATDGGGRALMLIEGMLETMAGPARLAKRVAQDAAMAKFVHHRRALWNQLDAIKGEIATLERDVVDLAKRREVAERRAFKVQPFALDIHDPRAVEMIGDAVRRDPSLLDKISKPN